MRHRPVADPEPFLAAAVDPAPPPGHRVDLADELIDLGVPPSAVDQLDHKITCRALSLAAEFIRLLVLSGRGTTWGVALERELLGDDGVSFAAAAAKAGVSRQAIHKAQTLIHQRLEQLIDARVDDRPIW